ncbi:MAG: CPBP family intramembrane metalloprotease [Flavobacteriaceae bacterium]
MNRKIIVSFFFTLLISISLFYFDFGLGSFTVILLTLFILLISYIEYGNELFASLGFQKKKLTPINLLVYAPFTAFIMLLAYRFLLLPLVTYYTQVPINIDDFDFLKGNLPQLIILLPFVWVSAAFGEEIIFRGYFMTRFTKIFGSQKIPTFINIIIFAIFFGLIHSYQGITGQILSGITGGIIATIFYFRKNDLWFSIVVHGMIDTLAFIGIYFNIF